MQISLFERSFPVPKYLRMDAFGLDISDRSAKIAKLKKTSKGIKPMYFANEKINEGIIEHGSINDKDGLLKIFQKIKSKHKVDFATISLPEEKAYVFNISISGEVSNLREAVELQIEEHVPFSADLVTFDFEIVGHTDDGKVIVSVTAFATQVVADYLEVFEEAGINVLAFEVEAHSLARAIVPVEDEDTNMIVDFGQTRTGFTIVSDGHVRFSTTVNIGGDTVVKAVTDKFEVTYDIAKKMKEERGLKRRSEEELFFVLAPIISLLRDEINKFLIYWDTRKEEFGGERPKIKQIFLCGGDANIPGLIDYLSSGFDTIFRLANPWVNTIDFDEDIPPMTSKESLRYSSAIGLALRSFSKFQK